MFGSVHGQVLRANSGKPLEYATIVVMHGAGPSPDIAPLTDSGGWFTLDGLPAGEWILCALGPSGETGEATVKVFAGSVVTIIIQVR